MGFAGFTDRELQIIAMRSNGVKPAEIAHRLGFGRQQSYNLLRDIYAKVGFSDVALLTRWAIEHGLDETLPAETSETRPRPGMPKPRYQRIKLGRILRAGLRGPRETAD
jgi:DNA-binding CsgD family transcriptional regulator